MDLLEPGFREIFFQQYSELPTVYDKIFHVLDSTRQQEYDSSISGFGQLVETSEGAAVTYEDPKCIGAYIRKVIRKFLKLQGTLFETICRQIGEIKKISESFRDYNRNTLLGDGIVRTLWKNSVDRNLEIDYA